MHFSPFRHYYSFFNLHAFTFLVTDRKVKKIYCKLNANQGCVNIQFGNAVSLFGKSYYMHVNERC